MFDASSRTIALFLAPEHYNCWYTEIRHAFILASMLHALENATATNQ